jgi:hypothetical protein
MKRTIYTLFLFILGINFQANAQVKAFLDTNIIGFADQTVLHLQVAAHNGDNVLFPKFKGDTIANFVEIVENMPVDTINSTTFILEKRYIITSFEDSIRNIPALPVIINQDTFYSNPLKLYVTSLQIDSAELAKIDTTQLVPVFDIKMPMDAKFTFAEFWLRFGRWILLSLIIIAIIAGVIYLIIRYKNNQPIKILEKPKEPAHIIALRRLNELKEKKLDQQGKIKEFYSELTDIVRTYIEQRFRVPALERTSGEIMATFEASKILDNNQSKLLHEILLVADLAKFAKHKPTPDINAKNWQNAFDFVENTKEIIEQQSENQEVTEIDQQQNHSLDNNTQTIKNEEK